MFSPTCEVILHPSSLIFQAVLSSALLAAVLAAPAAPVYGPPAPVAYPDEVPVYKYTYAVKDDYSFSNFNAHEERDGYNAAGGYQVALPDGRTQIVTYTATKVSTERLYIAQTFAELTVSSVLYYSLCVHIIRSVIVKNCKHFANTR